MWQAISYIHVNFCKAHSRLNRHVQLYFRLSNLQKILDGCSELKHDYKVNATDLFPRHGGNATFLHLDNVSTSARNAPIMKRTHRVEVPQSKYATLDFTRPENNIYSEIDEPDMIWHIKDSQLDIVPTSSFECQNKIIAYKEPSVFIGDLLPKKNCKTKNIVLVSLEPAIISKYMFVVQAHVILTYDVTVESYNVLIWYPWPGKSAKHKQDDNALAFYNGTVQCHT